MDNNKARVLGSAGMGICDDDYCEVFPHQFILESRKDGRIGAGCGVFVAKYAVTLNCGVKLLDPQMGAQAVFRVASLGAGTCK